MGIRSRSGAVAPAFIASAAAVLLTAGVASQAGAWSYKEAAAPYVGVEINILDEIQPLAYALAELKPEFEAETGIIVQPGDPEPSGSDRQGPGRHAVGPGPL